MKISLAAVIANAGGARTYGVIISSGAEIENEWPTLNLS